uniref:Uncharacterized protein n=1 Tax=Strigops habroptila TaxID=2489341 RepID=A0A672VC73_STRHB
MSVSSFTFFQDLIQRLLISNRRLLRLKHTIILLCKVKRTSTHYERRAHPKSYMEDTIALCGSVVPGKHVTHHETNMYFYSNHNVQLNKYRLILPEPTGEESLCDSFFPSW